MLDTRKEQMIDYLIQGEQIVNIAKLVGVSRQAIYNWMDEEEVKNELDKRIHEIKTQGNRVIINKLSSCIDELLKIALSGKSEKVRSDTAQYLIDRALGKPTTKLEQTIEDSKDSTSKEDILKAFESKKSEDNNV